LNFVVQPSCLRHNLILGNCLSCNISNRAHMLVSRRCPDENLTELRQLRRRGMTIIELLLVISILGVLIALLLPAIQAAREASRRNLCLNQLKQITLAAQAYQEEHRQFPPGYLGPPPFQSLSPVSGSCVGVHYFLLPYLEQPQLGKAIQQNLAPTPSSPGWWGNAELKNCAKTVMGGLTCPSDSSADVGYGTVAAVHTYLSGTTPKIQSAVISTANGAAFYARSNYLGISGGMGYLDDPAWDRWRGIFSNRSHYAIKDIVDGTSNTLMFGESCGYEGGERKYVFSWFCGALPTGYGLDGSTWSQFSSAHPGIVQFGYVDGSAHAISRELSPEVYQAMSGIADREIFDKPW
jgi:prepilin-type N-terminal cleavage/methylation domain-containing protein